jgi:hypothetical protein
MNAKQMTADPETVAIAFADLVRNYPHKAVELAEGFARYHDHALAVDGELVFAATCTAPEPTEDDPDFCEVREYVCPGLDFLVDTGEQPDADGVTYAEAVAALAEQRNEPFAG